MFHNNIKKSLNIIIDFTIEYSNTNMIGKHRFDLLIHIKYIKKF
jgi:hypothetical protein